MKYLSILLLLLLPFKLFAAESQTNVSGSNTSIEGGYTGGATTYESGSSSNTTSTTNSTSNVRSAPPTASAPSYNSMTQDVCSTGASLGVQTFGLGITGGKHFIDKNCERLKLSILDEDVPALGKIFVDVAVSFSANTLVVSSINNTNHFIIYL